MLFLKITCFSITIAFYQYILIVTRNSLRKVNILILIQPLSEVKFLLTFLFVLCEVTPLHTQLCLCNTSRPTMKATGHKILLKLVLYLVWSHCNTRETKLALYCIGNEVHCWFRECYVPSKVYFLHCKKSNVSILLLYYPLISSYISC